VGLPRRAAHFVLNEKKDSRMYAVNTNTGAITVVTPKFDEAAVLAQVKAEVGFEVAYFEIQFYGPNSEEAVTDDKTVYIDEDPA